MFCDVCMKRTREMTPKLLVIGPSFGDADFVIIAVRENCPVMKEEQDWHSPVYSGRLEYIHPVHWCTMGSLEFPVKIREAHETYLIYPMISISGTSGLSITFGTLSACRSFKANDYRNISHRFHRTSFCSRVYMYVLGMRYLTSRSTCHLSSTGIIMNFGRLRNILWNVFSS